MWVWRAWNRLTADRPWIGGGMGSPSPGNIPWSIVTAWAGVHDYDEDETDMLDLLIQEMDAEYLSWWREEAERRK